MWLGGQRSYVGVGSDCMHLYDPYTGIRRRAVMQDVVTGVARLVDGLPNIDFVMSMFLPATPHRRHTSCIRWRSC